MTNVNSFNVVVNHSNRRELLREVFMKTAILFAEMSTCARKQVGGVLVKNNRIVSTGFNGAPKGLLHCTDNFLGRDIDLNSEEHKAFSDKYELHCEQNILMECIKNQIITEGAILYLTLSPCSQCAKLIYAAGIKTVYYLEEYDRDKSGIDFLNEVGVMCNKFTFSTGE